MVENWTETDATSRELLRQLRTPVGEVITLPESRVWRIFCELRRRGEVEADAPFLTTLRRLHLRRSQGHPLPADDPDPVEHKLSDDPFLGELFRAYKRAICSQRIGPAATLLRDIEAQLLGN